MTVTFSGNFSGDTTSEPHKEVMDDIQKAIQGVFEKHGLQGFSGFTVDSTKTQQKRFLTGEPLGPPYEHDTVKVWFSFHKS